MKTEKIKYELYKFLAAPPYPCITLSIEVPKYNFLITYDLDEAASKMIYLGIPYWNNTEGREKTPSTPLEFLVLMGMSEEMIEQEVKEALEGFRQRKRL